MFRADMFFAAEGFVVDVHIITSVQKSLNNNIKTQMLAIRRSRKSLHNPSVALQNR